MTTPVQDFYLWYSHYILYCYFWTKYILVPGDCLWGVGGTILYKHTHEHTDRQTFQRLVTTSTCFSGGAVFNRPYPGFVLIYMTFKSQLRYILAFQSGWCQPCLLFISFFILVPSFPTNNSDLSSLYGLQVPIGQNRSPQVKIGQNRVQ